MQTMKVIDLRRKLGAVLDRVKEQQQAIHLTRWGKVVAVLSPFQRDLVKEHERIDHTKTHPIRDSISNICQRCMKSVDKLHEPLHYCSTCHKEWLKQQRVPGRKVK